MKIKQNDNDVHTYRRLRKAIGYVGFFLPSTLIILPIFTFFATAPQPSISDFYYTNLREILTGSLFTVGIFLICYKGTVNTIWFKNDSLLTNIAGVMAVGVAFFPTNPLQESWKIYSLIPYHDKWLGWLHYGFAASLFLLFALLSISVFTIGQQRNAAIPISLINENHIYRFCGWIIVVCIILIPVTAELEIKYATFILEAIVLYSFSISWLIKGRAFGDKGKWGEMVYRE